MKNVNISQRTILVNGLPVHYGVVGEGEAVVLVHGLSGSWRWWRRNIPAIAQHYQVYVIDLPGFGSMRRFSKQFELVQCAVWLDEWMQAVGLKAVHLVGHSMGGYVCMAIAALRPEKVQRLILVNSIGIPWGKIERVGRVGWVVTRLAFLAFKAIGRTTPAFWPYLVYDSLRAGPKMVRQAAREIVALDAAEVIAAITTPTLLIWGTEDDLVPLTLGRQLHERLAGSQFLVLEGSNHFCMFERPHEFNAALLAFLPM